MSARARRAVPASASAPRASAAPRAAPRAACRRQAGSVLILVAVIVVVLFAFGALAVDGSHARELSAQCQATADAAALAGARKLPDQSAARREAIAYGARNMDPAVHGGVIGAGDVEFGTWDFEARSFTATTVTSAVNAVRVKASRSAANANAMPLTLAKVLGFPALDVVERSTAAFTSGQPWNLVLLQDVTGSFAEELPLARKADKNLLDCFASNAPPTSLFGLVTFTGWSKVLAPLTPIGTGYALLSAATAGIKSCGTSGAPACSGTDIAAGMQAAVNLLLASPPAEGVSQAIVLVSDGQPEASKQGSHPTATAAQLKLMATQWADNAHAAGISLFVVYYDGENSATARAYMQSLVRGDGVFLSTPDPAKIPGLLSSLCSKLASLRLVD